MTITASPAKQTGSDYIRRQLQNEISDEYADRHDGAYPDEKYLNEETERRLAERTGMATPESAQA